MKVCVKRGMKGNVNYVLTLEHKPMFWEREVTPLQAYSLLPTE